jgi:hypothetical protein
MAMIRIGHGWEEESEFWGGTDGGIFLLDLKKCICINIFLVNTRDITLIENMIGFELIDSFKQIAPTV